MSSLNTELVSDQDAERVGVEEMNALVEDSNYSDVQLVGVVECVGSSADEEFEDFYIVETIADSAENLKEVPARRSRRTEVQRIISSFADSGDVEGRSVRRRLKTSRYDFEDANNSEEKLVQQAMKNSRIETCKLEFKVPSAPTFHPTVAEFADPLKYIKSVESEAAKFGICRIVPPPEWRPPLALRMDSARTFATKLQRIDTLQEGVPFDDGGEYTLGTYRARADGFAVAWAAQHHGGTAPSNEVLCAEYWDMVTTGSRSAAVEYGNDLDTTEVGSGFPRSAAGAGTGGEPAMSSADYYARTGWNLNNLPSIEGSVLRHVRAPINGVNVPWLYCGMQFSTFCWHNEDNYLYSINYSHAGADKQWYGVPGAQARAFEKASKDALLVSFSAAPDLLHHLTTQLPPSLLHAKGVSVCQAVQTAGSFIITFPKAYHCGFSYGFNIGEAVNFATLDWIPHGFESDERYRVFARQSVFSIVRLLFTLLHHTPSSSTGIKHAELLRYAQLVIGEETTTRPALFAMGVRSVSELVRMPANSFETVDKAAMDYDDRRMCCVCKTVCVFSAVACECNNSRVSCLRHEHLMCSCAKPKKFLLEWASSEEMRRMGERVAALTRCRTLGAAKKAISSDTIDLLNT